MTEHTPQPTRTGIVIWLIVSQLLSVGSLLIWALMAGLTFMAFDSGESPDTWTFVLLVCSYLILPFVLVIAAWIAFAKRRNMLAIFLSGLSFAPPVLFYVFLWVKSLVGP